PKTATTDAELVRLMSPTLGARAVGSVMPSEISKWFLYLREQHRQSDRSIQRYRASISSFFAWVVAEHRRADNPVTVAKLPAALTPPREMHPLTEAELGEVVAAIRDGSERLAAVVLLRGGTGP